METTMVLEHFGTPLGVGIYRGAGDEIFRRWKEDIRQIARCPMFESNFPVDRRSMSYATVWNGFKKMVADFSVSAKDAPFRSTAEKVYGLRDRIGRFRTADAPA